MAAIYDYIPDNIRHYRKEFNVKLESLAKELGISLGEMSKIENGQRTDYYKYLPQIANTLGIEFVQLVSPRTGITQHSYNIENGVNAINYEHHGVNEELYARALKNAEETIEMQKILIEELRKNK